MSNVTAEELPPERLPVWRIVKACYRDTFRHGHALAKAAAVPLLISVAVAALATGAIADENQLLIVRSIPDIVLIAFFEIAWLRLLLLDRDEAAPGFLPRPGARIFPYVGYALLLSLFYAPAVFAFLTSEAVSQTEAAWIYWLVAALVLYVVGIYFSLRLGFVYLWIAVDAPERLDASWRRTRGNGLRLLLILFIVATPIVFLAFASLPLLATLSPESAFRLETNSATGVLLWTSVAVEQFITFLVYGLSAAAMVRAFSHLAGWSLDRREILERFD